MATLLDSLVEILGRGIARSCQVIPAGAAALIVALGTQGTARAQQIYSPYELGKLGYITISGSAQFPTELRGGNSGNFLLINQNTGYAANLAIGTRLSSGFRVDFEASYLSANFSNTTAVRPVTGGQRTEFANPEGTFDNLAFFLSAYFDIDTGSPFRPFIGAGLGYSQVFVGNATPLTGGIRPGFSEGLFAYQARAGVNVFLSADSELFIAYRFVGTTSVAVPTISSGFTTVVDIGSQAIHNAEFGVRFNF